MNKTDTSPEGASDKLLKQLEEVTKRLELLEKAPAPSKIVVSKGFTAEEEKGGLEKIEDRLNEIAKIRDTKPDEYNDALVSEAFDLIKAKKALKK